MEISKGTRVAVFGATSDIAVGFIRLCAERGAAMCLVARDAAALDRVAEDARVRGARVQSEQYDFSDLEGLHGLVERVVTGLEGIDVALIAYGALSDNATCANHALEMERQLRVNFVSPASLLNELASVMRTQRREGVIAVITSVAGDRGRASNYVYGSAKAGLSAYCSGLGQALAKDNICVIDVRPGFVATKMTQHIKQGILFASPATVARGLLRAIRAKSPIVYLPWFWRFIMLIIIHIPSRIFRKISL